MNHVFKLVWNRRLGMLIPVPECSRRVGHGGRRLSARARRRLARRALQGLGLGALAVLAPAPAFALPTGGSVAGGTASISTNARTLTVNQTTSKTVINWQSFSISAGESVNFRQPGASSVALNRVLGNDASQIFGRLTANGQIFLVNPNGVFFAPGAQVDVGGLVASTLAITDKNFFSGNYQFAGASTAAVVNYAKIKAFNGGYVAFIGNTVDNEGTVSTPGGETALGAGGSVALTIAGGSLVSFQVTTAALNAAVKNGGAIEALNGVVLLTARAKNALMQTVVNNTGVIQADSATSAGGVVTLLGAGGNVVVSGVITANSTAGVGGTVVISGANVAVSGTARISATGRTGGGSISIGGGVHGGGNILQPVTTAIAAGAVVDASATGSGAGGTVSVWSDVSNPNSVTTVAGSILTRGAGTGAGGFVETSGHLLNVNNATVQTAGGNGGPGTWLLDPYDVMIASNSPSGTGFSSNFVPTAASIILNSAIDAALDAGNNVVIETGSGGGSNGNITINAAITWMTSAGLTLNAYGNIVVNAAITSTGSAPGLHLLYGQGTTNGAAASYSIAAPVSLPSNASFSTQQGTSGAPVNYTVITTQAQLQGINAGLSGDYALGTSITATGNFTPIGSNSAQFTGRFEGLGNTISNLTIYAPGTNNVGLFGVAVNAAIRDVGLLNESVTGESYVGGLAGVVSDSTITNSFVQGGVTGSSNYVGGLVGFNTNTAITASYATAGVSGVEYVGGLVGESTNDTITASHASGTVTGGSNVGGLAGSNTSSSTITDSYATGAVTRTGGTGSDFGGLVGENLGSSTITGSYATGAVSGSTITGGLVGYNGGGAITGSYATGTVTGSSNNIGGLVGRNSNGSTITDAYATGAVSGTYDVGGLAGVNTNATITGSYATGAVTGTNNNIGGLAGTDSNATITGSYATGAVSGNAGVGGLVGQSSNGTVTDDYATGGVSGANYVGGLVGRMTSNSTVSDSYASGAVSGINFAGGLVGYSANSTITDAYETGTVYSSSNVGGLMGLSSNSTVTDVYATGAVSGGPSNGGLMAQNIGSAITDAYWDTATTGQANGVGTGSSNGVTGVTTAVLAASLPGAFSAGTWTNSDGKTTPYLLADETFTTVSGAVLLGRDTSATPTVYGVINNQTQLQNINTTGLSGTYVLGNNIAATGDFTPIGSNNNTKFTGIFDGLGNAISNLTINEPGTTNLGLFGFASNATIRDVGLVNESVSGAGGSAIGGLAGVLVRSTITNSYAQGTESGYSEIGGLAGFGSNDTISASYATGSVSGVHLIGGLVGYATSNSTISDSYATSTVAATTSDAGGLVGGTASNAMISDAYATGPVTGSSGVGGLVGSNSGGAITGSYWDTTSSGQASGVGVGSSNGVTGLTTAALAASLPAGFSSSVWADGGGRITPYVQANDLFAAVSGAVLLGSDASATPTVYGVITSQTQLQNINTTGRSGAYVQGTDISATGDFTPIGSNAAPFTGVYDGLGNTIADLTINLVGSNIGNNTGLFGYISNATIRNVGLTAESVTGGYSAVGGLAGYMYCGTISNSYAQGTVTALNNVGGLVGSNTGGAITDSYATGTVSSTSGSNIGGLVGNLESYDSNGGITGSYATSVVAGSNSLGGLVGLAGNVAITNSYATGTVSSATGYYAGGLVGNNSGAITASYATGSVSAYNYVGGLVGFNQGGTITGDHAKGMVAGNGLVGGLVGNNVGGGAISGSYATGMVLGAAANIGGLVGSNFSSPISGSYATGVVSGSTNTGGLVGFNRNGAISESYATSAVTGTYFTGGLVGSNGNSGTITDAYATGTVSGTGQVGGLVGQNSNGSTINDTYATGAVTGSSYAAGLVGYNSNSTITGGYWDTATTGQANGIGSLSQTGVTGLATAQFLTLGPIASGTFSASTWVAGYPYPVLKALPYILITGSGTEAYEAAASAVSIVSILNQAGGDATGLVNTASIAWISAAPGSPNAAAYVLGGSGVAAPAGYQLTYAGNDTVTPLALTLNGLAGTNKIYDGGVADPLAGTPVLSGLFGSQTVTLANDTTGTLASANAGSEGVTTNITLADGANGGLAANYALTQPTLAAVTVSPAPVTITGLSGTDKSYNGTTSDPLTGTAVFSGLIGSQTLTLGNAATGTLASANAGSEGLTTNITLANGSNGGLAANYLLSNQPILAAVTVSPAALTINGLSGMGKNYDGTTSDTLTGTAAISGLIGGQTVALANDTLGALASANAGSEAVTTNITLGSGAGGYIAANYVLTQPALAAVTVSPAALTVTGLAGTGKTYDGTASDTLAGTAAISGLIGGQTVTLANDTTGTLASANAGSEAVMTAITLGSGAGGYIAANYELAQPALAAVMVSPATLTVTGISGSGKSYDGTTSDTLTGTPVFTGLVGGQTLTATGTLATANAGSEAVTVALGNGSNGGLAANYVLIQPNLAPVTISPAVLTITGLAGTNKTYDGTTIDPLTGIAVISGLIGGQTVTLGNDTTGTLAGAGPGSEAVMTEITLASGSNGWLAGNYVLIQPILAAVEILPASRASPAAVIYLATAPAALAFGYLAQLAPLQAGFNAASAAAAAAATAATERDVGSCGPSAVADNCKRLIIRNGGVKKPGPERADGVSSIHSPINRYVRQEAAAATARRFD